MAPLVQLTAWRGALMAARYRGVRTVEYDGDRVTYASDAEMATALADLGRKIATSGGSRVCVVRIASSTGIRTVKIFIHKGDMITVTTPTGEGAWGDSVIVAALLGIAAFTAEREAVQIAARGASVLPKQPTFVIADVARVALDAKGKRIDLPGTES